MVLYVSYIFLYVPMISYDFLLFIFNTCGLPRSAETCNGQEMLGGNANLLFPEGAEGSNGTPMGGMGGNDLSDVCFLYSNNILWYFWGYIIPKRLINDY